MCGLMGQTGRMSASFGPAFKTLAHRGPDGRGEWHSPDITLAHCRLAILDIGDGGKQPMTNAAGDIVIVFNGEIYNFKELRAELARSHTFRSESDTEVILRGYETEGGSFFSRMRGMWALAIYDRKAGKVILTRDSFGIKPLLYSTEGGELSFASEMRAMKELLSRVSPNTDAYYQFFNFGYFIGAETCYAQVKRILPGEIITWDVRARTLSRTMQKSAATHAAAYPSFDESVNLVDRALSDSVEAHFVSDVPVGLLLSGGNDSSLIAALAASLGKRPVAYTLEIQGSIDAPYAKEVAKKLGLPHESIPMTSAMLGEQYERAWEILDEPSADSSIIPTSLIYQLIKGKTKVVLSGEGGDELFGGYMRHRQLAHFTSVRETATIADSLFHVFGTSHSAITARNPALSRLRRFLQKYLPDDIISAYLYEVRLIDFPVAQERVRETLYSLWKNHAGGEYSNSPNLFFDRTMYLSQDLLYKNDIASMASSIEARVPFLDRNVLKTIGAIDPRFCLSPEYMNKALLRKVAEKYLPHELIYRPKKGFSFSFKKYKSDAFRRDVREALAFHAQHKDVFGLSHEPLANLLNASHADILISKYQGLAFALVSNWKIFSNSL